MKRKSSGRQANHRIRLLLTAFAFVFVIALARAAWLQGAQHDRLAAMAITQHRETIEVPAGRGTIYDRTGEPLAIGEQATTVYADPRNIVDRAARRDRRRQGARPRRRQALPRAEGPDQGLRLRRPQGRSDQGGGAEQARDPRARVLPGGAAHLSAGRGRLARPRLRRHGQPRPRRARALARQDALGPARLRDDRQGSVRPRDRRRHLAARARRQERDAHDRPPDPVERRADPGADGARATAPAAGPRS